MVNVHVCMCVCVHVYMCMHLYVLTAGSRVVSNNTIVHEISKCRLADGVLQAITCTMYNLLAITLHSPPYTYVTHFHNFSTRLPLPIKCSSISLKVQNLKNILIINWRLNQLGGFITFHQNNIPAWKCTLADGGISLFFVSLCKMYYMYVYHITSIGEVNFCVKLLIAFDRSRQTHAISMFRPWSSSTEKWS